jgi:hypothetical protein
MLDALRSGSTHALLPITPPACSHAVVRGHIAVHARFDVVVVVVGARDGEETFHGWALLMLSHGPGEGRCCRCECLAGGGGSVITGKPEFTPTRDGFPIRRVRKRLRRLTWVFPYG